MIQKMKSFAMDDVVEGDLLKYLVQKKTEKPGTWYQLLQENKLIRYEMHNSKENAILK